MDKQASTYFLEKALSNWRIQIFVCAQRTNWYNNKNVCSIYITISLWLCVNINSLFIPQNSLVLAHNYNVQQIEYIEFQISKPSGAIWIQSYKKSFSPSNKIILPPFHSNSNYFINSWVYKMINRKWLYFKDLLLDE